MAYFADINVSQGNVAALQGAVGFLITANLPKNLAVKKFLNRLRIDRIIVMSLWLRFLAHPVEYLPC